MDTKKIGESIKAIRKKMKMTQIESAGYLNVGVRFLSDLENGKPTIQIGKALQVFEGMGLEMILVPKSQKKLIQHIKDRLNE